MEEHMANFGAVIVKFWIHIDKDEQERRFKERMEDSGKTVENHGRRLAQP